MRTTDSIQKTVINRNEFNSLRPELTNDKIALAFLKSHPNNAYQAKTIAKFTKINKWTIFATLGRLVKKKLVEHKAPYYAITKKSNK